MSNNSISRNKNIFTVYVGLTAAGYDLAKTPENKLIHDAITEVRWAEDILHYYGKARTYTCEVIT